jgi:hypothetical protein
MKTFTLTFGDTAENQYGMQIIGKIADHGYSLSDLENAKSYFSTREIDCQIHDLSLLLSQETDSNIEKVEEAYILIAKNGLSVFGDFTIDEFYKEQELLNHDKIALMFGKKVREKKDRHNLCFADFSQEPDYEKGKGRVYNFEDCNYLNQTRSIIAKIMNDKIEDIVAEGNYYYDTENCGISDKILILISC